MWWCYWHGIGLAIYRFESWLGTTV